MDLGPPQQRAVLAVLLLAEGAPVRMHELVDALWASAPPASAVGSVRTYVHRLRKQLHPSLIRSVGDGYVFPVSPEDLDLAAFRDLLSHAERARRVGDAKGTVLLLRDALALWRGGALADLRGEYAQARRERLDRLRLSVVETLLTLELDLGHPAEVATELTGLVAEHPLDERFRELLMLALYRCGRQSAALDTYRRARTLLADELGIDPGPGLQRMYERILRADAGLLAPRPADEPAPARTVPSAPALPVPAQLPSGLPAFVGRAAQLAMVDKVLPQCDEPPVTVVIGGMAGVGKTTFAVQWARQVASRFPDGHIHVDLRGFDPVGLPLAPEHALRTILQSLGVAQSVLPQDEDALAALYRTVLADRRVLLLLDNAGDARQVRRLLPSAPGCLAIVTSRNVLSTLIAVDGAHPVRLDALSPDEAHDLLARRLGHDRVAAEPAAVQEIVERCARLPLALAVAAARATTRSAFPLAAFAAELRDSQGSLDAFDDPEPGSTVDVRAVFSWSYHALTPAAARLFRLLSLHPGPSISLPAAASLIGLAVPHTRRLLAELLRAHLLDEPAPGRYASHDLLRAYGSELARTTDPPAEHHATRRRVLDHYLHSAREAVAAHSPERSPISPAPAAPGARAEDFAGDSTKAVAWFAAEQTVLLAAVEQAAAHGFDVHTWQLAWAVDIHLNRSGLWRDAEAVHRSAMDAGRRLGDPTAQAHAHCGLAKAATTLGRVDEARAHAERSVERFAESGDLRACAESWHVLCWVAECQGDPEAALSAAQQSLRIRRAVHDSGSDDERDSRATAGALNAVGWAHGLLGRHQQALDHCREALALHRKSGRDHGLWHIWNSIGTAQHHLGQYDEAVTSFRNALAGYQQTGSLPIAEAGTRRRLGDTYLSMGRPDAARAEWTEALSILERLGHADAERLRTGLRELPAPDAHRFSPHRSG
ncbi:BTAD domain-containing putative transcriptional regulator [Streptomyces sp. NPDC096132]|uniref:AfsR/SARP family transcriptional regulator n=1 Tax=Streptomyces sp. NPDC096132 TaxID=3366075 RepID=UPI0037FC5510